MTEVTIYILIDSDGNTVIHQDQAELADLYESEIGADAGEPRRVVCVKVNVPTPTIVTLTGTVPAEEAPSGLSIS